MFGCLYYVGVNPLTTFHIYTTQETHFGHFMFNLKNIELIQSVLAITIKRKDGFESEYDPIKLANILESQGIEKI